MCLVNLRRRVPCVLERGKKRKINRREALDETSCKQPASVPLYTMLTYAMRTFRICAMRMLRMQAAGVGASICDDYLSDACAA